MKNKKPVAIFLIAMIVLSLSCGVVGLLEKSKGAPAQEEEVKYNVTYKYYLDDVEVNEMPKNPVSLSSSTEASSTIEEFDVEKLYAFNAASCTNKVTYKWDEKTWTFTPSNTADATCKLYFVSTYNELTLEATNATVTPLESNKIKRGEDAKAIITPKEGYIYDKSTCTNNEAVEWNEEKKELTIKSIYKKTTCKIEYKLSVFAVEIIVNNGTGSTKLIDKEYGSKIEANVAASTGYGTPDMKCTNNQAPQWNNGAFTIDKLTADTVCNIDFQLLKSTSFTVTLDAGNNGVIASGANPATVASGGTVTFSIQSNEGYLLDGVTCTEGGTGSKNGNIITVKNVTSNVSCTAVYKTSAAGSTTE